MNPCIQPVPVEDPNGEDRWLNQHKKFIRESQDKESEVIFIGDSLIQYLQLTPVWLKWFVPMHSLNFGIGGESTQHLLWRIQNGEFDFCKPKVIVVLIGTNNHGYEPQQIAEGIIEIAKNLRDKQPDAYIVLLGLLPRGKTPNKNRERNEKVNEIVRNLASSVPKCEVLDIGKDLVQADGEIDDRDMFDYLHLTATGYEKVFEPVYELLTQLLTEGEPEPDLDKILQD
ncbi:UNVERIFIED_CONTAM: hypothetical protein PYX00_002209 [Menopon gallinae]|uniref:SGNH hydrolase-type esterase domain-containing protein n=1 Tax=Menopon gallinae TaxID=328185 RepID=A0AAW2IH15_9NEOP